MSYSWLLETGSLFKSQIEREIEETRVVLDKSGDGGRGSSLLDPSESLALRVSRLGYIYFWGCMCS